MPNDPDAVTGPRVPYGTLDEPVPRVDPSNLDSYLDQMLDARDQQHTSYVVSAWHPAGEPTQLSTNLANHELLMTAARALDPIAVEAVAYAPDRSWVELAVIVDKSGVAFSLALRFGSPAVVKYERPQSATVYRADGSIYGTAVARPAPRARGCPILADPEPVQFCRQYGGPFGRRAIAAAADWDEHRVLLMCTLGCGTCENGMAHPGGSGRAISVVRRTCASRWGGPFEQGHIAGDSTFGL